jgi:hypothetical protein
MKQYRFYTNGPCPLITAGNFPSAQRKAERYVRQHKGWTIEWSPIFKTVKGANATTMTVRRSTGTVVTRATLVIVTTRCAESNKRGQCELAAGHAGLHRSTGAK